MAMVQAQANPIRSAQDLTPAQKAAALVVAIGARDAAPLLEFLDEEEVEQLAAEIVSLRHVPATVLFEVLSELEGEAFARNAMFRGGIEYAKELLGEWKGTRGRELVDRLTGDAQRAPFGFLLEVEPAELAAHLAEEHPQTIAVVLAHLPASHAARVMAGLEPVLRADVALRIAQMDRVSPEVVGHIEDSMRRRVGTATHATTLSQRGGVKELAAILNSADRAVERAVLQTLEASDVKLADEVRKLMFVFEDIVNLRDRDIQEVLRAVQTSALALALKGVPAEVRDVIVRNLSQRASETLLEEVEALGAVRVRDVEEAQTTVVAAIRDLDSQSKIVMRPDADGGIVE